MIISDTGFKKNGVVTFYLTI